MTSVAWAGAIILGGWVATYVAYTLGGVDRLQGLLLRFRPAGIALGIGLVLGSVVLWLVSTEPVEPLLAAPALALALLFLGYAWGRQWLVPRPAPSLTPGAPALAPDALVAVLEGGDAVPLTWLARLRTARVGQQLVVHCALARSLAAFTAPAHAIAAVLPHSSGFILGGGGRRWDGVDGRALDGGTPLERRSVALATYADWRGTCPNGLLHAPSLGARRTPRRTAAMLPAPPAAAVVSRLPAARAVTDAMRWGLVEGGEWRPIVVSGCTDPAVTGDRYYLSRWAAYRRRDERLLTVRTE